MSLLVCTPAYGSQVTAGYFESCLALKEEFTEVAFHHDWLMNRNESLIQRARNSMVADFLKTDFRKLLFIDADIEFEPEHVSKLWNMDVPICAGLYAMKRKDAPLSAWRHGKLLHIDDCPDHPFAVDYAGTGFLMIDREVFEAMREEWPERAHEEGHVGESFAWFDPRVENGIYLSEDYAFCEDARFLGYEIMADPSIRLKHWGPAAYGD